MQIERDTHYCWRFPQMNHCNALSCTRSELPSPPHLLLHRRGAMKSKAKPKPGEDTGMKVFQCSSLMLYLMILCVCGIGESSMASTVPAPNQPVTPVYRLNLIGSRFSVDNNEWDFKASAINNAGDVLLFESGEGDRGSYIYKLSCDCILGLYDTDRATASGISDSDELSITIQLQNQTPVTAAYWNRGAVQWAPNQGYTETSGIDPSGQFIIGSVLDINTLQPSSEANAGRLWTHTGNGLNGAGLNPTALSFAPAGVNRKGHIAGTNANGHVIFYHDGLVDDLGPGVAAAINDNDLIAGATKGRAALFKPDKHLKTWAPPPRRRL